MMKSLILSSAVPAEGSEMISNTDLSCRKELNKKIYLFSRVVAFTGSHCYICRE